MKMRLLAAATIVLAAVLIAATSHAGPSCCDPKNGSTPGATLAPGQPTGDPFVTAAPQLRGVVGRPGPAAVRATGGNFVGPMPQGQYAAAKPVGPLNAPAAPSCCALPTNSGTPRGINPATQGQSPGCGCCGGNRGQAATSVFQPASGPVQFMSNPPSTGQQVNPAGQASCCTPKGPGNIQGGRNASQPTGFPGLW